GNSNTDTPTVRREDRRSAKDPINCAEYWAISFHTRKGITSFRDDNPIDPCPSCLVDSAAAYNEAQAKWDKAAAELNTVLATISNTVSQSNDRMSDVNRRAAASWG